MLETAIGFGLGVGVGAYGMQLWDSATNALATNHKVLQLPRLPEALEGLRILHASDFHLWRGDWRTLEYFAPLGALEADIVLLTGDFADDPESIPKVAAIVETLSAPLGTYACLGNHDHATFGILGALLNLMGSRFHMPDINDVEGIRLGLEGVGCRVLDNANLRLEHNDCAFALAGVDDPVTLKADLEQALDGISESMFTILLAHTPDIFEELEDRHVDLTLSGHTHGGQILWPLFGELTTLSNMRRGQAAGVFAFGEKLCHISRGLGYSKPLRTRVNCPPEATTLELRRGEVNAPQAQWRSRTLYRAFRQAALEKNPVP